MPLWRVVKRRTAWESTVSFEDTFESEFTDGGQPDLALSTYDAQRPEVVQTYAEHSATAGLDPKSGTLVLMDGIESRIEVAPTESPFAFLRAAHREVMFADVNELRVTARRIIAEYVARRTDVSGAELKKYVRERCAAGDAEWLQFCPTDKDWAKLAK